MLRMEFDATQQSRTAGVPEGFSRTFGSRLTKLRSGRGWTQRELSRRARIDPGRLSKLEHGGARVTVAELIRLSQAFGAGLDELVYGGAASLEGECRRLLRELEALGGPSEAERATRWLQALVLSLK